MISSKEILNQLESLAQLDIDAIHAYTSAIDRIELPEIKNQLVRFREDHERHVTNLSPLIEQLGGNTPKRTPDFKGFLIQGFTAIRSMMGDESALKAMKVNEELTNKTYDKALQLDLPADIFEVVQANRVDERRHLDYINQCINDQIWEHRDRTVA